jgi:hypothetical protein
MNTTPLIDSFNRGELSPKLHFRADTEWYKDGVKTLTNFVTAPRGAARKRTGFRYLGRVAEPNFDQNIFPQRVVIKITTPQVDIS